MRLVIHAQVIHLHPEVYFLVLIPLEQSRLAIGRGDARPNLGDADYKIASAHILRGHGFDLIRHNSEGGGFLV